MTSPLGHYSQAVAGLIVIATISAYLFAVLTNNSEAATTLVPFATLAFGAVLGSVATVNGYKNQQADISKRLTDTENAQSNFTNYVNSNANLTRNNSNGNPVAADDSAVQSPT